MAPRAKMTEEERRDEALHEKFGSQLLFEVKVLRPSENYPYERTVWESSIRVPVDKETKHVAKITEAWIKTMEAGIELAGAFREEDDGST